MDNDDYLEQLIFNIKKELTKKLSNFSDINNTIDKAALRSYAKWTTKSYTRVCLFENEDFELILICWNPKAQTPIHDHDEKSCRVFFFDGPFQESIYCEEGVESLTIRKMEIGSSACMKKGRHCHSLKNMSDERVMTLHLYNEPIKTCRVRKNKNLPMEKVLLKNDFTVEMTEKELLEKSCV